MIEMLPKPSPKSRPRTPKAFTQAVVLQKLLMNDALSKKINPKDRALLVAAWDKLEERKRILRNKPLLKPIDAVVIDKRKGAVLPGSRPAEMDFSASEYYSANPPPGYQPANGAQVAKGPEVQTANPNPNPAANPPPTTVPTPTADP